MERLTVVSSHLKAIGYDPVDHTLEVEFVSGAVYQYPAVPEALYTALMGAPSKGKYLEQWIKPVYAACKVDAT